MEGREKGGGEYWNEVEGANLPYVIAGSKIKIFMSHDSNKTSRWRSNYEAKIWRTS